MLVLSLLRQIRSIKTKRKVDMMIAVINEKSAVPIGKFAFRRGIMAGRHPAFGVGFTTDGDISVIQSPHNGIPWISNRARDSVRVGIKSGGITLSTEILLIDNQTALCIWAVNGASNLDCVQRISRGQIVYGFANQAWLDKEDICPHDLIINRHNLHLVVSMC